MLLNAHSHVGHGQIKIVSQYKTTYVTITAENINDYLFSFYDIKLNFFTISNTAKVFSWVVLHYGRLVNKNIFFRIITENKRTINAEYA